MNALEVWQNALPKLTAGARVVYPSIFSDSRLLPPQLMQ